MELRWFARRRSDPTLGGYITDNFDWRWIFFINVPVAIVSLFLTNRIVEDPPHIVKEVKEMQKKGLNLDFFGFWTACTWVLARWSLCWTKGRRMTGSAHA